MNTFFQHCRNINVPFVSHLSMRRGRGPPLEEGGFHLVDRKIISILRGSNKQQVYRNFEGFVRK